MSKIKSFICCLFCIVILCCNTSSLLTVNAASANTVTTNITKIESKAKGFKVTFEKKSKIKGYQIQYSTSSKFDKSKVTHTITNAKTNTVTVNKLKGCNVVYYVRVRTYKISNDKKVFSSWSKAKKVTTLAHKYSAATCTKAKVCKYCNKTSGDALGHKWSAATCAKAKTCVRCKKITGEALGHKWSKATCAKPKTCSRCKKTSGSALGHKWKAATYTTPKKCTVCGKTSGSALAPMENYHGHVYTGGSSSKRYHYEADCAGKYSHEITWDEVSRRGLTPCGTCVMK